MIFNLINFLFNFSFFSVINSNNTKFEGVAEYGQIGFQDPATSLMIDIIDLHHEIFFYLIIILFFVGYLILIAIYQSNKRKSSSKNPLPYKFSHSTIIEILWTIIPSFILCLILLPSLASIYSSSEIIHPHMTLKAIGHQWYWSYEYSDIMDIRTGTSLSFDSNLIKFTNKNNHYNLLEVDNRTILPVHLGIRLLITSEDVLHSWCIPSFGIKMDACPGRLNQVIFSIYKLGIFRGQCSEICGVGHGFMPIVVESCYSQQYFVWAYYAYFFYCNKVVPFHFITEDFSELNEAFYRVAKSFYLYENFYMKASKNLYFFNNHSRLFTLVGNTRDIIHFARINGIKTYYLESLKKILNFYFLYKVKK